MGGDRLPDELLQLFAEDLAVELPRVRAQLVGVPGDGFDAPNGVDQALHLLLLEQHPGATVDDRIERAAAGVGDHRPPAGVGFERRDAEVLFAREHQRPAPGVQLLELGVGDPPDELDVAACARLQRRQVAPAAADDLEPDAEPGERVDRQVDALVRNQPRDDQVVVVDATRAAR